MQMSSQYCSHLFRFDRSVACCGTIDGPGKNVPAKVEQTRVDEPQLTGQFASRKGGRHTFRDVRREAPDSGRRPRGDVIEPDIPVNTAPRRQPPMPQPVPAVYTQPRQVILVGAVRQKPAFLPQDCLSRLLLHPEPVAGDTSFLHDAPANRSIVVGPTKDEWPHLLGIADCVNGADVARAPKWNR